MQTTKQQIMTHTPPQTPKLSWCTFLMGLGVVCLCFVGVDVYRLSFFRFVVCRCVIYVFDCITCFFMSLCRLCYFMFATPKNDVNKNDTPPQEKLP